MTVNLAAAIRPLSLAFRDGLRAALPNKLCHLALHGAIAFPDGGSPGDIDFTALLNAPLSSGEQSALHSLHHTLARDYPPLGAELDGYYLLLADVGAVAPLDQLRLGLTDDAWALHRAHIRAGRCIILHGSDLRDRLPAPSWPELAAALAGELAYVEQVMGRYPHYAVLNLARLAYSHTTRDVVISKRAAAVWAAARFPQWRPALEAAGRVYDATATAEDEALLQAAVRPFFGFAAEQIETG